MGREFKRLIVAYYYLEACKLPDLREEGFWP